MFLIYAWTYFLIVIYVIQDNYFFLYFCLPGVITFSEYLFLLTILTSMLLQLFSYKYIKLGLWCCWFCYSYVNYIVVHLYQSGGTRGAAKCVTDVLTRFQHLLWSITVQTQSATWSLFVLNDKNALFGNIIILLSFILWEAELFILSDWFLLMMDLYKWCDL